MVKAKREDYAHFRHELDLNKGNYQEIEEIRMMGHSGSEDGDGSHLSDNSNYDEDGEGVEGLEEKPEFEYKEGGKKKKKKNKGFNMAELEGVIQEGGEVKENSPEDDMMAALLSGASTQ